MSNRTTDPHADAIRARVGEQERQTALGEAFADALRPAFSDPPHTEATPTPDTDDDFLTAFDTYMKENHR